MNGKTKLVIFFRYQAGVGADKGGHRAENRSSKKKQKKTFSFPKPFPCIGFKVGQYCFQDRGILSKNSICIPTES